MLRLSKFIGKGAVRLCFEHPEDANKCIRVTFKFKEVYLLEKELRVYKKIKDYLGDYLVKYDDELVSTNLGKGMVCELLRDDNKQYSRTLYFYIKKGEFKEEITAQMLDFAQKLLVHDLFFYDFNLDNFILQIKDGKPYLKFTDLKSFEKYKPWTFLKLEKVIKPLARHLMKRRLKRRLNLMNIDYSKVL